MTTKRRRARAVHATAHAATQRAAQRKRVRAHSPPACRAAQTPTPCSARPGDGRRGVNAPRSLPRARGVYHPRLLTAAPPWHAARPWPRDLARPARFGRPRSRPSASFALAAPRTGPLAGRRTPFEQPGAENGVAADVSETPREPESRRAGVRAACAACPSCECQGRGRPLRFVRLGRLVQHRHRGADRGLAGCGARHLARGDPGQEQRGRASQPGVARHHAALRWCAHAAIARPRTATAAARLGLGADARRCSPNARVQTFSSCALAPSGTTPATASRT